MRAAPPPPAAADRRRAGIGLDDAEPSAMTSIAAIVLALAMIPIATPAASCVRDVPGLGRACQVADGYEIHLADGTTMFTHGADPAPPMDVIGVDLPTAGMQVSCVGDEAVVPHGLAVYVQPPDLPNRFAQMTPDIQSQIETANAFLGAEAAEFGVDLSYRMACDAGRPKVVHVVASANRDTLTFQSVVDDLKTQGYGDTNQKYWMFIDGPAGWGGFGGFGTIENSSVRSPYNNNNFGPSYASNFGYTHAQGGWFLQMHESGHNLGAVQNNAFMASGGWHCNDGRDVMCYADGGSRSNYNPNVCSVMHFDCRHDDYFNPRPPEGDYLARSWNLASPMNRWVAGCAHGAGRLLPGAAATVSVAGCTGRPFAVAGFAPPVQFPPTPTTTLSVTRLAALDVDVCFSAGLTSYGCFDTLNQPEVGEVPVGATTATITLGASAIADYTFSVI